MNELEKIFKKFPNKDWDYTKLSNNPNLTIDMIQEYPNKPWNYTCISRNKSFTFKMLEAILFLV